MNEVLPEGWRVVNYESVVNVHMTAFKLDDNKEYSPVIVRRRHNGVETRERKLGRKILVKNQYRVKSGTFLISKRQIFHGSCGLVPDNISKDAIISKEYLALETTSDLDIRFLNYFSYTNTFQQQIIRTTYGIDVEKFVFKDKWWMKELIPLPPIEEQKKIASILSSIDEVIEKTTAQVVKLKDLKTSLMQELLTKGIGHSEFKDSPVGRIPVEWEVLPLGDVVKQKISYGIVQAGAHIPDGIPYIKSSNVGGEIDIFSLQRTAKEIHHKYRRSAVHPNDIIFSLRGNIARTSIVPKTLPEANLTQGTARVSVNSKNDVKYIYYQLASDKVLNLINIASKGTTFQEISLEELRKVKILTPPLKEQKEIAKILTSVDQKITTTNQKLSALTHTKKALMQDLLTGKKRVI